MTKDEFLSKIVGRRIESADVNDELEITSIELDDGSRIFLSGSLQIGVDDVWASLWTPVNGR